ncbi:MAG: endonuclease III [Acholeplasmataceae bacterium]
MTKKAQLILDVLEAMYPDAKAELTFTNHFELLVAVVLSAQTTDIAVNNVTPQLFKDFPTPAKMAATTPLALESYLRTIGLYRNKAKHIHELANQLVNDFQGTVPNNRKDLESLRGVGRKTANVVISNAFGIPAIAVDTHVERVSKRLGIAKSEDSVLIVEHNLMKLFPKEQWLKLHHQLIFFGRYHCLAKKPKCGACKLYDVCQFKNKRLFL